MDLILGVGKDEFYRCDKAWCAHYEKMRDEVGLGSALEHDWANVRFCEQEFKQENSACWAIR